ncbi:GNAT family N-acetyltransferase [Streptomyces monashensis]|uniref:GNAT family N-acetyltransferase n=1 Tax=Streptomyces monashensis TaxID=1678012 RepID=A0A1S2QFA6_9ACTN|nr:GNAT family N-acetyltransferase [Streptomyces monashensis]OIK04820.1 GNAT family N-acetyltransferase [Streptomyces monashensis]
MADAPPPPGELTLRPLGFEHLAAVLDLGHRVYDTDAMPYTGWSLSAVAGHLDAPDPACLVMLDGDRVAGFVLGSLSFEQRADWGYLEWIAVDPAFQGRGVASRLVKECCARLAAAGAVCVVTDVERRNTASAALMRRNGFAEEAAVSLFVRPLAEDPGSGARRAGDARAPRRHLTRAAADWMP